MLARGYKLNLRRRACYFFHLRSTKKKKKKLCLRIVIGEVHADTWTGRARAIDRDAERETTLRRPAMRCWRLPRVGKAHNLPLHYMRDSVAVLLWHDIPSWARKSKSEASILVPSRRFQQSSLCPISLYRIGCHACNTCQREPNPSSELNLLGNDSSPGMNVLSTIFPAGNPLCNKKKVLLSSKLTLML